MKKLIFLFGLYLFAGTTLVSAQAGPQGNGLATLLSSYYNIKNSLVSGDAGKAAASATGFVEALKAVNDKSLSEKDAEAFAALKDKLKADAGTIASSTRIESQRTAFASLSDNVYSLAKAAKLSTDKIYQQYCPMKKLYWLSDDAAIKNPYYGKQMLTCGKVTDTLKQ